MSVINDVLLSVIDMALEVKPYATITVGALPADDSLCMAISSGAADAPFLTRGMSYELNVVFNGKNAKQQDVLDALNDIHQYLTQTKIYPRTDTFQITNIDTTNSPSYIGREENKQYLYGSSLRIRFFYKKGTDIQ